VYGFILNIDRWCAMQRIGEVAMAYDISKRTLHYWEESGILKRCRMKNDYRYYKNKTDYNTS
jgi:DNA-binding transcriptional MerR regulator